MMSDEEYRRLQAKFDGGPTPPSVVSTDAMSDETFEALQAKFEPELARPPLRAAANPLPEAAPKPRQATTAENLRYAAGGLPQGYADIADTPYFLSQAIDAVGEYIPDSVSNAFRKTSPVATAAMDLFRVGNQRAGQMSEREGLRQAKEVLAPEFEGVEKSPLAQAVRTGLEWAGPGAVAKAPKILTGALRSAVPDVAMGVGAAGGEAAVNYLTPEYSWVGELGGGLAGLGVGLATGRTAGLDKNQRAVLTALNDMYDDPEKALAELKRRTDAGEIGTIGDLTREPEVFDAENWAATATPEGRRAAAQTATARIGQIYDEVTEPMRTGVPAERAPMRADQAIDSDIQAAEAAALRTRTALDEEAAAANTAAREADTTARRAGYDEVAAVERLDPGRAPYRISQELSDEYSSAAKAFDKAEVRPAWAEFEAGDVDIAAIKGDLNVFERGLRPKQQEDLARHYDTLVEDLRTLDANTPAKDVQGVIADMKDAVNAGYADTSRVPTRATRLLDDLTKNLEANLADTNPAYGKAVAKTKELYDRFSPDDVGRARGTAAPEVLAQKLGLTGDQGAVTARLVAAAKTPALQPLVADYIKSQAVRTANLGDDFLIQYEAALDGLPSAARADVLRVVQAKKRRAAADTARDAADKEAQAVSSRVDTESRAVQRNLETQEAGLRGDTRGLYAADPNGTIDRLLTKTDGATDLKTLMEEMTDLDEVASFKANIGERLERALFKTTRDVDSGAVNSIEARAKAYQDYLDMQDNLLEAGVLDAAETRKMESAIERTNTEGLRKASRAYDITQQTDEHINLLASGGAAAILGPMPGAYSLMVGGAIRRSLNSMLHRGLTEKRLLALSDYLNNPKKYLADLDKLDNAEDIQREFMTRLVGASQAAELIGGDTTEG